MFIEIPNLLSCCLFTWKECTHHELLTDLHISNLRKIHVSIFVLSCFRFHWWLVFSIKTSTVVYACNKVYWVLSGSDKYWVTIVLETCIANEVGAHYCYVTSMFICKCFRLEKLVFSGSNTDIAWQWESYSLSII